MSKEIPETDFSSLNKVCVITGQVPIQFSFALRSELTDH
jgi:hypothetical protein